MSKYAETVFIPETNKSHFSRVIRPTLGRTPVLLSIKGLRQYLAGLSAALWRFRPTPFMAGRAHNG